METLLTAIAPIVTIISENFWLFIIIIAFLCSKDNRIAGLLLIAVQVTFGYHAWIFVIVVFVTLCTNFLSPKIYYEKQYRKKIDEFNRQNPAAWRIINGQQED